MPLLIYYDVLGVPQFATQDRIKKAYFELRDDPILRDRLVDRRLVRIVHPASGPRMIADVLCWSVAGSGVQRALDRIEPESVQ